MKPSLDPEETSLDYGATLRALLALVGEEVQVVVGAADGKPVLVSTNTGTLLRMSDVTVNKHIEEQEALFFKLQEQPMTGFLVHAGTFNGGEALDPGVRFLQGSVLVKVTPTADSA